MAENYSYNDWFNQWLEMANEGYRAYVKSLVWSQEMLLEWTKMLAGEGQPQNRLWSGDYMSQLGRGPQLWQNWWQESMKASTDMFNQFRSATANFSELNTRLDNLQTRVEGKATHS